MLLRMYRTHMQILVTLVDEQLLEYDINGEVDNFSSDREWGRTQLREFVKEAHRYGGVFEPDESAFIPMSQVKEIGMTVPKSWEK